VDYDLIVKTRTSCEGRILCPTDRQFLCAMDRHRFLLVWQKKSGAKSALFMRGPWSMRLVLNLNKALNQKLIDAATTLRQQFLHAGALLF